MTAAAAAAAVAAAAGSGLGPLPGAAVMTPYNPNGLLHAALP